MSAPAGKAPLSVLLLVRDEIRDVEQLLPQLAFAAEVVVVWDPRGDRAARDAAERLGARVFERAFDGFGPQRAFALAQCTQPWVLWLDADERPDSLFVLFLQQFAGHAPSATHFAVARSTWFLGRRIEHCGWGGETVLRVFQRELARFDDALVHEQVRVEGERGPVAPGRLEHHSYRTWNDCTTKMFRYAPANAAKAFAKGKRANLLDVVVRPPLRFLRMYVLQLGVLDGVHGLLLCVLASVQVGIKYAELRRLASEGPQT